MRRTLKKCYCFLLLMSFSIFSWAAKAATQESGAAKTTTTPGMDMATVRNTLATVEEFLATKGIDYGLKILAAIVIFLVGKWLAKVLTNLIGKAMTKAKIEPTLVSFVKNVCYVGLIVFVAIAAMSALGIQTAQFIAVIGAAGLAVGLALQGSLSNFASGVLLIMFQPFKVGDFVELAGTKGTVQAIHIFNTVLNTLDNIRVTIPNAQVTGGSILNYTINGSRRVDLVFGVSYGDDINKAKKVIEGVLATDNRVLKEPSPTVAVLALADSSVNFVCRPWVKPNDYWDVYFDVTAKVKLALESNGLTIPFPQRDVHMKNETA
ncbi:MAG: mechanosensitive ion channel [Sedimentisphaerales bacterium]|nr:mechanosensitive ion channel [Sedimentisphaerales bacterium]